MNSTPNSSTNDPTDPNNSGPKKKSSYIPFGPFGTKPSTSKQPLKNFGQLEEEIDRHPSITSHAGVLSQQIKNSQIDPSR